jgi:hypothetical protein
MATTTAAPTTVAPTTVAPTTTTVVKTTAAPAPDEHWLDKEHKVLAVGKNVPTTETIILAVATGLGAWGGFPEPPRGFNRLVGNDFFKYFLVFVLLMQGGAGKNYKLAGLVTAFMYILHKILDR